MFNSIRVAHRFVKVFSTMLGRLSLSGAGAISWKSKLECFQFHSVVGWRRCCGRSSKKLFPFDDRSQPTVRIDEMSIDLKVDRQFSVNRIHATRRRIHTLKNLTTTSLALQGLMCVHGRRDRRSVLKRLAGHH